MFAVAAAAVVAELELEVAAAVAAVAAEVAVALYSGQGTQPGTLVAEESVWLEVETTEEKIKIKRVTKKTKQKNTLLDG